LLLVAKTAMAHTALSRQLKARTIQRRYLALVEGHVPLDEGTMTVPLGRHLAHRKLMTVRHLGGRHAVTHYRVLHRLQSHPPPALPYTILEVSLETGRTHQIRVHMAHLGYPVLGDTTYGRHPASYWAAQGMTRQLLHAYAIRFAHPLTRAPMALTIDPPADLHRWLPEGALEPVKKFRGKHAE
jgi:23S rRNA pseudouridine1911/1915/1917 synthase